MDINLPTNDPITSTALTHFSISYLYPIQRYTIANILDSIDCEGWQCGGPQAVETPGLMLGLAGIGYQMLRLAEPDRVPSVLGLATLVV